MFTTINLQEVFLFPKGNHGSESVSNLLKVTPLPSEELECKTQMSGQRVCSTRNRGALGLGSPSWHSGFSKSTLICIYTQRFRSRVWGWVEGKLLNQGFNAEYEFTMLSSSPYMNFSLTCKKHKLLQVVARLNELSTVSCKE